MEYGDLKKAFGGECVTWNFPSEHRTDKDECRREHASGIALQFSGYSVVPGVQSITMFMSVTGQGFR